jgi:UDP-N-acetylglucosamine 1-carboxyvinyltransferase
MPRDGYASSAPATTMTPPGMALIGAALCARGTSTIMNAHQVDRGYERIDERLRSLGARITREPGA